MNFPEYMVLMQTETVPVLIAFARMGVACLLGAAIGFEREHRNRSAGLRTHMLVALAAAVFTLLMLEIVRSPMFDAQTVRVDPLRIIEAVTGGVAFLAAGAIIQSRGRVHGLTTGAGLWLAGALGTASGLGYGVIAAMATGLGLIVIIALRWIENAIWGRENPHPSKGADNAEP